MNAERRPGQGAAIATADVPAPTVGEPTDTRPVLPYLRHDQHLGCPAGCQLDHHECGLETRPTPSLACGSVDHERYCSTRSIEWLRWAGTHGCPCRFDEAMA